MTHDQRPPPRPASEIAAELAFDGHCEAAAVIRDLVKLCRAHQSLTTAYRLGTRTPDKALETIRTLKWRLDG